MDDLILQESGILSTQDETILPNFLKDRFNQSNLFGPQDINFAITLVKYTAFHCILICQLILKKS
jgi:hypothetical protein